MLFALFTFTIPLTSGNVEEEEIILDDISDITIDSFFNEIQRTVSIPENGVWDISWRAYVGMNGGSRENIELSSTQARVDLRSNEQRQLGNCKHALEMLAHRRSSEIQSALRNHKLVISCHKNRQQIEEEYAALHPVLSKGRDVQQKLYKLLKSAGEASCPALLSLEEALVAAEQIKSELEQAVRSYGKRDARKHFQRYVANLLERGEAEYWILNVTEEELANLGGDANRLYQWLIEGKKANSLVFNETALEAAQMRSDLFTSKQCETLQARRDAVEALYKAEFDHALIEAERKEADELKRRKLEFLANSIDFPRGTKVRLHGLQARPELNGSIGTYMGLGQGDRFVVRLDLDGKEIAVKLENFSKWKFGEVYARTWSCKTCTFLHDGELAHAMKCNVCDTPKEGTSIFVSKSDGTTSAEHPKNAPVTPPASEASLKPRCEEKTSSDDPMLRFSAKSDNSHSGKSAHKPTTDSFSDMEARETIPSTSNQKVNAMHDKSALEKHIGQKVLVNDSEDCPSSESITTEPSDATDGNRSAQEKGIRCRYKSRCSNLKRSATGCKYIHTAEEIAVYHPTHPSTVCAVNVQESNPPPLRNEKLSVQALRMEESVQLEGRGKQTTEKVPNISLAGEDIKTESGTDESSKNGSPENQGKPPSRLANDQESRNRPEDELTFSVKPPLLEVKMLRPKVDNNTQSTEVKDTRMLPNAVEAEEKTSKETSKAPQPPSRANKTSGKQPPRCWNGLNCRKLRNIPSTCPFYHPSDEIAKVQGLAEPKDVRMSAEKLSSESLSTTSPESVSSVEREVLIEANAAGHVIGKGRKHLYSIMKRSGAKISVSKTADSNGMCTARISGKDTAVEMAAGMVIEAALRSSKFPPTPSSTEEVSLISGLSENQFLPCHAPLPTQEVSLISGLSEFQFSSLDKQPDLAPSPNISTPDENDELIQFLRKHQDCIKCEPDEFHRWLISQDITGLRDLNEACADNEFVTTQMQASGLKGFKRGPFVKAVKISIQG